MRPSRNRGMCQLRVMSLGVIRFVAVLLAGRVGFGGAGSGEKWGWRPAHVDVTSNRTHVGHGSRYRHPGRPCPFASDWVLLAAPENSWIRSSPLMDAVSSELTGAPELWTDRYSSLFRIMRTAPRI